MIKKGFSIFLWVVALALACVSIVHASGYAIIEQGVRGLGTAYAGAAALAEDPSTIFYNPAGLVRVPGKQVEVGLHYIAPTAEYTDKGSTTVLTTPLTGGNGDDGGAPAFVPNLYYSHQLSNGVVAGIGINAPFGLATEYEKEWVGRYHGVESKLSTININPTVAARMNDKWSVGAGFNIQHIDATLSNKADFGTAGAIQGVPGATPQGHDGFGEVTGDSWSYGFNFGFLYEPAKSTRFGLAFRSSIHHKVDGEVDYEYDTPLAQAIARGAGAVNGPASAVVDLPEILSLAAYHDFNDKLAVVADVTYTNWERFDEIRIKFETGPDSVVTTHWDNSMRYGLGLIYRPTDKCTGRIGFAFDETPIRSEEFRTPRIPDEDRYWIALGAAYKFTDSVEVNLGYVHIFVDDPVVDKKAVGEDALRGNLTGEFDATVDIFSVNVNLVF